MEADLLEERDEAPDEGLYNELRFWLAYCIGVLCVAGVLL